MRYIKSIEDKNVSLFMTFWQTDGLKMPKLKELALRVLSAPASSALVERVFSKSGYIVRLHRCRIAGKILKHLVFLKCNENFLSV